VFQYESELILRPDQLEEFNARARALAESVGVNFRGIGSSPGDPMGSKFLQFWLDGTPKDVFIAFEKIEPLIAEVRGKLNDLSVKVDFPGGPLEDYVGAITEPLGFDGVQFGSEAVRKLWVQPIKLDGLDVASALSMLEKLPLRTSPTGGPAAVSVTWIPESPTDRRVDMRIGRMDDVERFSRRYRLARSLVVIKSAGGAADAVETRRAVFGLGGLKGFSTESLPNLLDAVHVALELDGGSTTFKAKYHEPSGLLIVRGTRDELGVVQQVLKARFPGATFDLPGFDDPVSTPMPATESSSPSNATPKK
jgi:hypothetical protein